MRSSKTARMDEDDVAVCAHCDLSARIQAELAQARIAVRCADADLAALCDAELTRQEWLIRWRAAQRSRAHESALTTMLHDMLRAHGDCYAEPA